MTDNSMLYIWGLHQATLNTQSFENAKLSDNLAIDKHKQTDVLYRESERGGGVEIKVRYINTGN